MSPKLSPEAAEKRVAPYVQAQRGHASIIYRRPDGSKEDLIIVPFRNGVIDEADLDAAIAMNSKARRLLPPSS